MQPKIIEAMFFAFSETIYILLTLFTSVYIAMGIIGIKKSSVIIKNDTAAIVIEYNCPAAQTQLNAYQYYSNKEQHTTDKTLIYSELYSSCGNEVLFSSKIRWGNSYIVYPYSTPLISGFPDRAPPRA